MNLSLLPNYTDFSNLYDQYKICAMKQRFVFNKNSADVVGAAADLPMLITVYDSTDGAVLASEANALEYQNYRAIRLDRPVTKYCKFNYRSALDGGMTNVTPMNGWFPTNAIIGNQNINGMKWAITTTPAAAGTVLGNVKVYTTMYIQCKNPK